MLPATRPSRKRGVLVAGAALAAAASASLASPPVLQSPLIPAGNPGPVTTLAFDAGAYASLKAAGAATLAGFVLPGGAAVDLEVAPIEVFTPDAVIVAATERGPVALQRPDQVLLTGTIAGEPDSRVFLSLTPSAVNGFISRAAQTFILSSGPHGHGRAPVIYDMAGIPPDSIAIAPLNCGTDLLPAPPWAKAPRRGTPTGPRAAAPPAVRRSSPSTRTGSTPAPSSAGTPARPRPTPPR